MDRPAEVVAVAQAAREADASPAVDPLLEEAWGIIANAGGGDWKKEAPEWHAAAIRWREAYHARLRRDPADQEGARE